MSITLIGYFGGMFFFYFCFRSYTFGARKGEVGSELLVRSSEWGDDALMAILMLSPIMVPVLATVVSFMSSTVAVLRCENGKAAAGHDQQRPDPSIG